MNMLMHERLRLMVNPESGQVYGRNGKEVGAVQPTGYRRVGAWVNGKCVNCQAHRVVWEAVNGEIPDGLFINHINGVKTDNRIKNLELVTMSENNRHAYRTGLASNKGERHSQARLTWAKVAEIRRRFAAGESKPRLAAEFGIVPKHVQHIVNGKCWRGAAA